MTHHTGLSSVALVQMTPLANNSGSFTAGDSPRLSGSRLLVLQCRILVVHPDDSLYPHKVWVQQI